MPAIRTAPVLAAAALSALAAAPATASARQAGARLVRCHPALSPGQRSLTVEGQMSIAGPGERMQMRFDLYRRSRPGAAEVRVPGPGLGTLYRAGEGVRTYRFRKTVRNLAAPADYRMRVTMTWRSPQGEQLAQLTRFSALCRQPELRPDLRVVAIDSVPAGQTGRLRYTVTVRNSGATAAGGFDLAVGAGDNAPAAVWITGLAAGASRIEQLPAGPCPAGEALLAQVDRAHRVAESSEANNTRGLPCTAAGAAPRR